MSMVFTKHLQELYMSLNHEQAERFIIMVERSLWNRKTHRACVRYCDDYNMVGEC